MTLPYLHPASVLFLSPDLDQAVTSSADKPGQEQEQELMKKNKYAIYAYTRGPVTGSGPSVVTPLLPPLVSCGTGSLLVELRVPPSLLLPPSLIQAM